MTSQDGKHERINQKRRTRGELLRAARELTEQGLKPSVADVADHAGISRATAYRYFSAPEELVREAVLDAVASTIGLETFTPDNAGLPAEERVAKLVAQVLEMVEANEPMFRSFLASTVTGAGGNRRGARRMGWLSEALEPLKSSLPPATFRKLVYGLSLTTGVETLVVLKDVCGLSTREAKEVSGWVARTLLAGALAARDEPGRPPRR